MGENRLVIRGLLPDHNHLEKMDDIVWPTGIQYPVYGLSRPVLEPLYNTKNSGDVIIKLAKQIGGSVGSAFPWKNYEEVLKTRAKGLFDNCLSQSKMNALKSALPVMVSGWRSLVA